MENWIADILLVGRQNGTLVLQKRLAVLLQTKYTTTLQPRTAVLGIIPKEMKTC